MNFNKYKSQILLTLITLCCSLFFYLAFYKNLPQKLAFPETNLETIYANYDGPNYMIIAKCGYNKDCIRYNFSLPLPLEYYPAHLPGYPLIIKLFSFISSSIPKALILSSVFGSVLLTPSSTYFLNYFSRKRWLFTRLF